jgi:bacteriocin-like protein
MKKLEEKELQLIEGGITALEYCTTLVEIINNSELDAGANEGAVYGWNKANCTQVLGG